MWEAVNGGLTIGQCGSEGGRIICDEEYNGACCITLEECPRYYAVTCGVYGGFMHTAFFDESSSKQMYEAMKQDLKEFIDRETSAEDEEMFYDSFTSKY